MIPGSKRDQTFVLSDGRTLGYAEYGFQDGKPIFYFHGHPGARLEARFLADQALQAGVRLIGVDRPGMGLSTYAPGRRLLDWPDDVSELADKLGIDHFAVVGLSGGGPYVLACAYSLPNRLTAGGLVSGLGHLNPGLAFLSQWMPWLLLPLTRRFFQNETGARESLSRFSRNWVAPDQKCLAIPGIRELMAASLVEGLRQGAKGAALDGAILGRPWGFQLEDIQFSNLYLWHGELDKEVPVKSAREVAKRLAHCQAAYYPADGHISTIVNHAKEIVDSLAK